MANATKMEGNQMTNKLTTAILVTWAALVASGTVGLLLWASEII